MLGTRQLKSYTETCTVFAKSVARNTDGKGKPGNSVWSAVKTGVPYMHEPTTNFPQNTEVGQDVVADIMTADSGHFDIAETTVHPGAIIKNTGGASPSWFGQFFEVLEISQPIPSRGNRKANKQIFRLRLIPNNAVGTLYPGVQ